MAVRFTIAKRGPLPGELEEFKESAEKELQEQQADELMLKMLRPRLEARGTVDAVEYQNGDFRLPSVLRKGDLLGALDVLRRVMLHELRKGYAVRLPELGTFRLSLKGDIERKDGNLHGRGVHVDGLLFEPDRSLLADVCRIEVEQVPVIQLYNTPMTVIEKCLDALFAKQDTITNSDLYYAFGLLLTRRRITTLLTRLVREGRLIREGKGSKTRYRRA